MRNSPAGRVVRALWASVWGLVALVSPPAVFAVRADEPQQQRVEFNRDIRPILSDACYHCHGPDAATRQAELRLDTQTGALGERDGGPVVVPGDPAGSELFRRISAGDPHERMPPADSSRTLTAEQIELIGRWIEQGADWQEHWAFVPPRRPPPPATRNAGWPRNTIDRFVLARLEQAGLSPAPEADKTTLLRRVTLDLTGLPPTPAEVDAFLADPSPEAYEKLVDRLLESPRYGERMASRWLDAARYADSNGYQSDGERFMWRWRDWVIDAYNANMPFDRFTIEQLAGDLLPGATLGQQIATGFNRNHRGNAEGGIIPEEYAVEYVVDRVDTTFTVWLGLTMGCARCHDHKYDPITQREFYQVYDFFNNIPERGKAVKFGNSPPMIKAPTPDEQQALAALEQQLGEAELALAALGDQIDQSQLRWEAELQAADPIDWVYSNGLSARFELNGGTNDPTSNHAADGTPKPTVRGELAFVEGPVGPAVRFDGQSSIDAGGVGDFGYYDKFTLAVWIRSPRGSHGGTILSRMAQNDRAEGYHLYLHDGRLHADLVKRWLDDGVRVSTQERLEPDRWHHLTLTYDGSRVAEGVHIYLDGKRQPLNVHLDDMNQSFKTKSPFRIGTGGEDNRFQGDLADVRVYARCLKAHEVEIVATPESITGIAAAPVEQRTPAQTNKLRAYFLEHAAPPQIQAAHRRSAELREQRELLIESFPTTMVMQEMDVPRESFVLIRGEYDKPGERVTAGVPASLPPWPADAPGNRLGFAHWLVDPSHPLTARVAVNRYWQMYFGNGLVKTLEDFGSQGQRPSHPELLDWLATEFIRTGWNVKALQKRIVMSATYRQSSRATPDLLRRDPDNRLLARGPRLRLSAEMIRDQALAAGGLLVERIGGPSVKPYQPAGLWEEVSDTPYEQDTGDDLYRRSLYTFWKRTAAPPAMTAFDASGRETCVVHETRTNTPLQALTLLNDVTFVEAARGLAQRAMREGGTTPEDRLAWAFRLAASRRPTATELRILADGFKHHHGRYRENLQAAKELLAVGESLPPADLPQDELAAYTTIAGLILNLDEVITKE